MSTDSNANEAIEALASELWSDSNPDMPVRDCDAWQECIGLARRALNRAAPILEANVRAKIAEEAEVEWASFLAHSNSAGIGYAYLNGHDSREDAQEMADHLATPERPAWVAWRTVHPWQHDHPDPEHAGAIARGLAVNGTESHGGATEAPPESQRTRERSETRSGLATGGLYTGPPIALGEHGCVIEPRGNQP